jgi:ribokinase
VAGRVVVLGSVNLDVVTEVAVFPAPGETVIARGTRRNVGGKGGNQAVAAHRLGAAVTLVARVGDDDGSAWLRSGLASAGLDVTAVRPVPGQAAGAAYIAVAAGENTIIVDPGANHAWPDGLGPDLDAVAAADVLVLQHEVPAAVNGLAVAASRGRVVLNAAPSRPVPPELLARCDPLVLNAHELADQLKVPALDDDAVLDDGAVLDGMRRLLDRGARSVVTTLGPRGAVWASGAESDAASGRVPAVPVDAVDSTGAGDCFVGALAAELATGAALPDAARWAAAAASASVRTPGTHASYPDRAAVQALLP